jgi:type II secretory pathway pseudopilin PulG
MSLTIKPAVAAVVIALIGVLAGLALGQITEANSSKSQAKASAAITSAQGRQIIRELRDQSRQLKWLGSNVYTIGTILGTSKYSSGSIHGTLNDIRRNTGKVCYEVGGIGCSQYSAKVDKRNP